MRSCPKTSAAGIALYKRLFGPHRGLLKPVPTVPTRHLLNLTIAANRLISDHKPSSVCRIERLPGETVRVEVQWAEDDGGRALWDSSTVKQREQERTHTERANKLVADRVALIERLLIKYSGK